MKQLTLVRHAKAEPQQHGMADFDRALNARGEADSALMGQRLVGYQANPQHILSSPAKRAIETARLIAHALGYPDEQITTDMHLYNAMVSDLIRVIEQIDNAWSSVLLVGHNPGIASLMYYLTNEQRDVPTCAVAGIDLAVASWTDVEQSNGTLAFFDYPKKST